MDCSEQIIQTSSMNLTRFASKLKITLHDVMFFRPAHYSDIYFRLFIYKKSLGFDCLKKLNPTQWLGDMKSLMKFTYTNSKEQLKIIWNSRNLELIDF
ncbi:MAG: hypothetical protein WD512_20505 [Candidatus Paceibacterota bacterium]